MTTAQEYRDQLDALKARIADTGEAAVRQGHIRREQADSIYTELGLALPEDAETRTAREELEAFQNRVRETVRTVAPSVASEALCRLGL